MRHNHPDGQSPAAITLLGFMEEISEEHWAAGWLTDLEVILWRSAQGDSSAIGSPWPGCEEDAVVLRKLSEMCQGWWAWDDERTEAGFVPITEWLERVAASG